MPVFASRPFRHANVLATPIPVSASAARLTWAHISNENATAMYLHIYNKLFDEVTVGDTEPQISLMIPGGGTPAGLDGLLGSDGLTFGTAISIVATAEKDAGDTAPGTGLLVNFGVGGA